MNRTLYKKVTQELVKLLKYITDVMERIKEGRDFDSEREYEKYVQDLTKGIEMLNLLLEANLFYKNNTNFNDRFFNDITSRMFDIRHSLREIMVYIPNEQEEQQTNNFFEYDFAFPIFNRNFNPILPKFVDTTPNMAKVAEARGKIIEFNDL